MLEVRLGFVGGMLLVVDMLFLEKDERQQLVVKQCSQ